MNNDVVLHSTTTLLKKKKNEGSQQSLKISNQQCKDIESTESSSHVLIVYSVGPNVRPPHATDSHLLRYTASIQIKMMS